MTSVEISTINNTVVAGGAPTSVNITNSDVLLSVSETNHAVTVSAATLATTVEAVTNQIIVIQQPLLSRVDVFEGVADAGFLLEKGPQFTYSGGRVSRIDYDGGNYKLLTYSGGRLASIVYYRGAATITKTFVYNPSGTLNRIDEVEA